MINEPYSIRKIAESLLDYSQSELDGAQRAISELLDANTASLKSKTPKVSLTMQFEVATIVSVCATCGWRLLTLEMEKVQSEGGKHEM